MKLLLIRRMIGLTIVLAGATGVVEAQRIEQKTANYGIFYQAGQERDARFAQTWLDRALHCAGAL